MPAQYERIREASKRQIMGDLSPNKTSSGMSTDPQSSVADHEEWLKSIYDEMEKRINDLKDQCDCEKNKQQQVFASAMVKLSRNVKNMTVSEFNAVYKVDLLQTLQRSQNMHFTGTSALMPLDANLQTPGGVPKYAMPKKKNITTPFRTVRKGEQLL